MAKPMKKSSFSGKVRNNAEKTKAAGSSYGYLNLPQGVSVFSAEPGGKARIDIMPYVVGCSNHPDRDDESGIAQNGELWYKRPFKSHRNIGSSNDAVVCLTSIGKKCPICEARSQLIKEGAGKEETDALKASARNLYAVFIRDDKKYDEDKIHIWDISQYLFQNLLADELMESPENEVFPDLECGKTLKVRFESKTMGKGKPFANTSRIDFEDRDAYSEKILDKIPCLDTVLNILTYAQLEQKFLELEPEDVAESEPEPEPPRRKPRAPEPEDAPEPPRRKPRDEEPEPPRRKPRDEEPEPPKRKPKGVACVACEGSGENSRGGECKICQGTGFKPDKAAPEKKAGPVCEFGHKYGIDNDKYDSCDQCQDWNACCDASDAAKG